MQVEILLLFEVRAALSAGAVHYLLFWSRFQLGSLLCNWFPLSWGVLCHHIFSVLLFLLIFYQTTHHLIVCIQPWVWFCAWMQHRVFTMQWNISVCVFCTLVCVSSDSICCIIHAVLTVIWAGRVCVEEIRAWLLIELLSFTIYYLLGLCNCVK